MPLNSDFVQVQAAQLRQASLETLFSLTQATIPSSLTSDRSLKRSHISTSYHACNVQRCPAADLLAGDCCAITSSLRPMAPRLPPVTTHSPGQALEGASDHSCKTHLAICTAFWPCLPLSFCNPARNATLMCEALVGLSNSFPRLSTSHLGTMRPQSCASTTTQIRAPQPNQPHCTSPEASQGVTAGVCAL